MKTIPQLKGLDQTLAFLQQPYTFGAEQADKHQTDVFQARLLLQPFIFLRGEEYARTFYDSEYFVRDNAMPQRIVKTLLGQGGVQGLDGEAHQHRKHMLLSLMTPQHVEHLTQRMLGHLHNAVRHWKTRPRIVLYDEIREVLCRSVCEWAGVPLPESEVGWRTQQLSALFGYAGAVGPKHWWARLARELSNRWAKAHIHNVRDNPDSVPKESASYVLAVHRGHDGHLLDSQTAAVELINILRPTVAVSVYITFLAHALTHHPESRDRIAAGDEAYIMRFVQEVRRKYPFFPMVAAKVRKNFVSNGCPFHKGQHVLLDLYATNHDSGSWIQPDTFNPDRFLGWEENLYSFIPQGGGDPYITHRCPGERIAVELMKAAAGFLVNDITYQIPQQDLQIDYTRVPALPRSRFVMSNIR